MSDVTRYGGVVRHGETGEVVGVGEGTLSDAIDIAQSHTALALRTQLDTIIDRVQASKLKLKDKANLLSSLVRAHESLTKSERMTAGHSDRDGGTTINAGVIVVTEKKARELWHRDAVAEVEQAKEGEVPDERTEG